MALKLSGMAAKNFALFVYAVLKDQKKTHGKTRLVRMLREQRPFKFFNVPTENMKEFATEAKTHGLLYVPIRNKQKADRIEVVVFADDASKVQRIFDNLGLDAVKAQAGEATIASVQEQEKQAPGDQAGTSEEKRGKGQTAGAPASHPQPFQTEEKEKTERKVMPYRFIQFNRQKAGSPASAGTAVHQGRIRRHEAGRTGGYLGKSQRTGRVGVQG